MRALLLSLALAFSPNAAHAQEYIVPAEEFQFPLIPASGEVISTAGTVCWTRDAGRAVGRVFAREGMDAAMERMGRETGRSCTIGVAYEIRIVRHLSVWSHRGEMITLVAGEALIGKETRPVYMFFEGEPVPTL